MDEISWLISGKDGDGDVFEVFLGETEADEARWRQCAIPLHKGNRARWYVEVRPKGDLNDINPGRTDHVAARNDPYQH